MDQTSRPPFPRDDDFYRRQRDRSARMGEGEPTLTRFFQTQAGPGTTPYPRDGNVYYGNLLRDVTYSPVSTAPGSAAAISGTPTGHFEYLYNLAMAPPAQGAIVKAVKIGARWWIDTTVSSSGFPAGVGCDPFDCVYPGAGSGACADLAPNASGLPDYEVNFGHNLSICQGAIGGLQVLRYFSNCEWRSAPITCVPDKLFWKLTIDPGASNNGEQGAVFLQLFDYATGQPYSPALTYCSYGGYPLFCALCDNALELCCGVGQNAQSLGGMPGAVCVKPYRALPNCSGSDGQGGGLAAEYLVTIDGFSGSCVGLNGTWIVQFCPSDISKCIWTGLACAGCSWCVSDGNVTLGVELTGMSAGPAQCTANFWGIFLNPGPGAIPCACGAACGFMPCVPGGTPCPVPYISSVQRATPAGLYLPFAIAEFCPSPYPASILVTPLP